MNDLRRLVCLVFILGLTGVAFAGPELLGDGTNALALVDDPLTSSNAFDAALKALDNVKTEREFWLQITADQGRDPNRRRKCVKYLFEHIVVREDTLGGLLDSLKAPVNWVSIKKIKKVSLLGLDKWPKNLSDPEIRCIFFVPILSEKEGSYRLGIYIAFAEDLVESDVQQAFGIGTTTKFIRHVHIVAFSKIDTDDVELKHPGESARLITW